MVFYEMILCGCVYIGCFPKTSEINFEMESILKILGGKSNGLQNAILFNTGNFWKFKLKFFI